MLRIEPRDSGDGQDERCVGFACRVDTSLTQPEGQMVAILDQRHIPTFTPPGGSPQLHLVLPPEGIALGHTLESRPGSQCSCDNAAERKAAECSFETAPSSLTAASRGGKHRLISKSRVGLFVSLVNWHVDSVQQKSLRVSPRTRLPVSKVCANGKGLACSNLIFVSCSWGEASHALDVETMAPPKSCPKSRVA
jgi:hypothetical protein